MTHHTHHDPAVRDLIAQAEQRGAERVAQAVEKAILDHADHMDGYTLPALSPNWLKGWGYALYLLRRDAGFIAHKMLAEHRDEHPAPEPPSDVTEDEVAEVAAEAFDEWLTRMHGVVSSCRHEVEGKGIAEAILARFHVTPRAER